MDLRSLRPFRKVDGRQFESFASVTCNPTNSFNKEKFKEWIEKHKHNIIIHYPAFNESEQSAD